MKVAALFSIVFLLSSLAASAGGPSKRDQIEELNKHLGGHLIDHGDGSSTRVYLKQGTSEPIALVMPSQRRFELYFNKSREKEILEMRDYVCSVTSFKVSSKEYSGELVSKLSCMDKATERETNFLITKTDGDRLSIYEVTKSAITLIGGDAFFKMRDR